MERKKSVWNEKKVRYMFVEELIKKNMYEN